MSAPTDERAMRVRVTETVIAIRDGQYPATTDANFALNNALDRYRDAILAGAVARVEGLEREVERLRALLNTPEIEDFARGVVLEAAHQRQRWDDSTKTDFDWAAVAHYLLAKSHLNPPQNDGTTGDHARLHRLIALGALAANWHAAVASRATPTSQERES